MQYRISHNTGFTYDQSVSSSYNEARMTPTTSHRQVVLHTRLDVSPTPWLSSYTDYWGTAVTAFEVHELHHHLSVVATSAVDVSDARPVPVGLSWWEMLSDQIPETHAEYLTLSAAVVPGDDLLARARDLAPGADTPSDFARAVCELIHREVQYVQGSTDVQTRAQEAWAERKGVCQDIVHLTLGCLRSLGVPSRYVSGYLHPRQEPQLGETVHGESHAWVEWWDGAWIGFDPTNASEPSVRHIMVAAGREYSDVAPLTGIFTGGGTSSMFVEVELTRTA